MLSYVRQLLSSTDWLATLVAIVAMAVTLRSARRALRLQRVQVRNEYLSQVREWAREVVAVMSESTTACELDPERAIDFFTLRNRLRTRLSELIDRGRWFFENTKQGDIGQWKEGAFRGLAPEVISIMKRVLALVESLDYRKIAENPATRRRIVEEKRQFVSEIQRVLKPSAMAVELDSSPPTQTRRERRKSD